MNQPRRPRSRGFIFLETMVATTILALVLGMTFRTVSQLATTAHASAQSREALLVARSAMALAGPVVPLEPGITRGVDGRYTWQIAIERAPGSDAAGPMVRVTATAGTAERPATVSLTTLKLPGMP